MKFGLNTVLALSIGTIFSCSTQAGEAPPAAMTLTNQSQRVSYSIGLSVAAQIRRVGFEVDPDIVALALKDSLAGGTPKLTDAQAQEVLTSYQMELRAKREEARMKLAEKNRKESETFFAQNRTKENIKVRDVKLSDTNSVELQYKIITDGIGETPKDSDIVSFNFRSTLVNGTEFDSTAKHGGQPTHTSLNHVLPRGAREALATMKIGSKWQLFLPSSLAYGDFGNGPIEPGAVVIYEVELVGMETAQPLTSDIIKVPSKEEIDKGAKVEIIKAEEAEKMARAAAADGAWAQGPSIAASFAIAGGDSGLKNVAGQQSAIGPNGVKYILALGEALESGDLASGKLVVVSAGTIQARSDKSITLQFPDKSTRTWKISSSTPVCGDNGQSLTLNQLTTGAPAVVRWQAANKKALTGTSLGPVLNLRQGALRYRYAEANGTVLPKPALADHSCGAAK